MSCNISEFRSQLLDNLTGNILPYWIDRMEDPRGGFYGRRDGDDNLDADAPKGAILNARILWSFSAAYIATSNPDYLAAARRAYEYICSRFIDREHGGAYWSLDADGNPLDTKKQFYAIAFIIYGLSEYYRACGDETALELALSLFNDIEAHSLDRAKGGYIEATTCDWQPIADMRLSDHDANASKTMNTHLHILEGYTNLLRALKEKQGGEDNERLIAPVREATANLIRIFLDKITDRRSGHLILFFDDDWNPQPGAESYGHDIEASWLLLESAHVVGDPDLTAETLAVTSRIADAGLQGRCWDGSMVYERHPNGHYDNDKHWWVQAENVIGQLWLELYHGRKGQVGRAWESWRYIADNLVDPEGEWHWSCRGADGSVNRTDDKAGFWKCPYHNSRMCLEAVRTLSELESREG
ncbi:MAG: AGE family epimerase/isomerase [Staphylococcus sp.]|nr:AGE family epimerase/isomerase [Staphylococcus sp.]